MDRLHLVGVLEEMLGVDKVQDILGKETWFKQIQDIRTKARQLTKISDATVGRKIAEEAQR
jgi:hypothetical protein